uniref:Uncharacterized protein n=1 Tax=Solanum lycopersicum TaxID=4081 RepID=A0A494GA70_SOLLC
MPSKSSRNKLNYFNNQQWKPPVAQKSSNNSKQDWRSNSRQSVCYHGRDIKFYAVEARLNSLHQEMLLLQLTETTPYKRSLTDYTKVPNS